MRLVSQDGMFDVPYEKVCVAVDFEEEKQEYHILVRGVLEYIPLRIAIYSTEAKALKVMEMLREEYLNHIYGTGGELVTRNLYIPPFAFIPPKVFEFPSDEEVETKNI